MISHALSGMPTFSVVIPSYNSRKYLANALDSVLAQNYPQELVDIFICDDGSRDDSAQIAQSYVERHPRIQLICQANAGQSAARNRCIAASSGELIAFLDSDDTWEADKLMLQGALYRAQPELGLIHGACSFVDPDGRAIENYIRKSNTAKGDVLLELFCDFFLITSAVVVPRHCLDEVGDFDETLRIGEDLDLFLRLLARWNAGCVDTPVLNRTIRADSLSREDYDHDARCDLMILERFAEEHPQFAREHRAAINARLASYHFDFGYRLLDDGHLRRGRGMLTRSLRYRPSIGAAKALIRSVLPRRAWSLIRA